MLSNAAFRSLESQVATLEHQGQYEQAEHIIRKAVATYTSADSTRAHLLGMQAHALMRLDRIDEALEKSHEAVKLVHRCGDRDTLVALLDSRAEIRCFACDFPGALRTLHAAEEYLRDGDGHNGYLRARLDQTRGMAYSGCGWWEAAARDLRQAMQFWEHQRHWQDWALAASEFANLVMRQGESEEPEPVILEEAIALLQRARPYVASNDGIVLHSIIHEMRLRGLLATIGRNAQGLKAIRLEYAALAQKYGEKYFGKAGNVAALLGSTLCICRTNRAWVDLVEPTLERFEIREILDAQTPLLNTALRQQPKLLALWIEKAALQRVRAKHKLEDPRVAAAEAALCLETAIDLLRAESTGYIDPEIRAGWLASQNGLLQELAETAQFAITNVEPSLPLIANRMVGLAQFLRAQTRRDLIRNLISLDASTTQSAELEDLFSRIRSLQRWLDRLDALYRFVPDSPSRDMKKVTAPGPSINTVSLNSVVAEIVNAYQEYADLLTRRHVEDELKYRKSLFAKLVTDKRVLQIQLSQANSEHAIDATALQSRLSIGEAILDYYVGSSALHVAVLTPETFHVFQLTGASIRLINKIAKVNLAPKSPPADLPQHERKLSWQKTLADLVDGMTQLSPVLMPPEIIQILTDRHIRRVYVVPTGPLWRVPFAWLDACGKLALERWEICMVPSAAMAGRGALNTSTAAFAIGHRGPPPCELAKVGEEVQFIGNILHGTTLLNGEATPTRVLNDVLPTAQLLHFACHGECDPISPLMSCLVLEPDKEHPDGRLRLYEVLRSRIQAFMVNTAACYTAKTEGPASFPESLAHAFLGAGARFVLASLWAANDEECIAFAREYYSTLQDVGDPVIAFQSTQQSQARRLTPYQSGKDLPTVRGKDLVRMANFIILTATTDSAT